MDKDKLISVYRAANAQQASIIRSLLENAGIKTANDGDTLTSGAGELPVGWATAPRIRVWVKDEAEAKQVIENFENGEYEEALGWQGVDYGDGGFEWPECPECEELRYVQCNKCDFIGIDFETEELFAVALDGAAETEPAVADTVAGTVAGTVVLKCPICAEKSPPRFVDSCRNCKHLFESVDTIENSMGQTAQYETQADQFSDTTSNLNAPVVIVGLLIAALLIGGTFYFLFVL